MLAARALLPVLALATAAAQQTVSFPTSDGAQIYADLYGRGSRAVVLAHGGRFGKESWAPQARALAAAGFWVLALDFRGYGRSIGPGYTDPLGAPLYLDVLAAVGYLKVHGAASVSVIGASMGGAAAGDASIASQPGEIEAVVMLGSSPNRPAEALKSRTLFLVARDDASGAGPRLPRIQAQFDKAPGPKRLVVLEGSAHAQALFQTGQADRVMYEIIEFLASPSSPPFTPAK